MTKKLIKLIACILIAAVCACTVYYTCFDPYRGDAESFVMSMDADAVLTAGQAKEDIDYTIKKLRSRHPAWLEKDNSRVAEVEARYEELISSLTDSVTVSELYDGIGRVLNPLHDGHTYIYHMSPETYVIDDFSYINRYGRPVAIDGEPLEDIISRYLSMQSYEVESVEAEYFCSSNILVESDLKRAGVDTSDGADFTYVINGEETVIHHDFVPYEPDPGGQQEDNGNGWVYYEIDESASLGIFTLTTCVCNDEYRDTVKRFFEAVHDAGISNVCIDLRGNGGGSSSVANEFIRYLDVDRYDSWDNDVRYGPFLWRNRDRVIKNDRREPQFSGDVYVLTDKWTYSAAMDFTMLIMDNGLGTAVGEASGNLPDSYGDCICFVLPNSKLDLSVSYKRWYRVDRSKSGRQLIPDVECIPHEALNKVYELIAQASR